MKNLLLVMLTYTCLAQAKISELSSYKDLNWNEITGETLVVFDIDNTLLRQNHMVGTHQWGDYLSERAIRKGVPEPEAKQIQYKAFAELQAHVQVVPVENEVYFVLKKLSEAKIAHFALTARSEVLKQSTKTQLRSLNFNFSNSFPKQKNIDLLGSYFDSGIIFSGSTPKGELLKLIIQNSEQSFKKIIFIDDKRYNLESVEKSFKDSNIIPESYRYGAADGLVNGFNPNLADVIYSIFKDTNKVISDNQGKELIGSPIKIVEHSFDNTYLNLRPVVHSETNCFIIDSLTYNCRIYERGSLIVEKAYHVKKDKHNNSYYFGNW